MKVVVPALILLLAAVPVRADDVDRIVDLMKEVETRLNEATPDGTTQADQKKIVEAMKFEDKTKAALDDLIAKLERDQDSERSGKSGAANPQTKLDESPRGAPEQRETKAPERPKSEPAKATSKPAPEKASTTDEPSRDSERWGDLLPKTYDDAEKARGTKVPNKMRDSFEKYLEEVNKK